MAPDITLYILGGCVVVAGALFIVMIVLSVMRPPQLPMVAAIEPPPLYRVPTPMPLALPPVARSLPAATHSMPQPMARQLFDDAPTSIMPRSTPSQAPSSAQPTVQLRPIASVPSLPSLPRVSAAPLPPQKCIRLDIAPLASLPPPPLQSPVWVDHARRSMPTYRPARSPARFLGVLLAVSLVAAAPIVAHPALLDPLCDDYEWFGADATRIIREQAREANAALALV